MNIHEKCNTIVEFYLQVMQFFHLSFAASFTAASATIISANVEAVSATSLHTDGYPMDWTLMHTNGMHDPIHVQVLKHLTSYPNTS